MTILNTEYCPHLSRVRNMTSTKKEVRERSITQGTFHRAFWRMLNETQRETTQLQTSEQHYSIDMGTDRPTNMSNEKC